MRKVLKKLKKKLQRVKDIYQIKQDQKGEIVKFQDDRRKAIYEKVTLTEDQKSSIDFIYENHLGRKIPYIWHQHSTAFTGEFDPFYFPELLYIPLFERFMNMDRCCIKALSNKNLFELVAKGVGIKTPVTYISCVEGLLRNKEGCAINTEQANNILFNIGNVFCKPTIDTNSGIGCFTMNIKNGVDIESGKSILSILGELGDNWAIQEKVLCQEQVSKLHPSSCNTFRIITYRWNENFNVFPAIMRIGTGGHCVDNAHQGGVFIAIDENGELHDTAFTEFNDSFNAHPDTGIIFKGYTIDGFPLCIEGAKKLHQGIPQIGVVNWDFTLDIKNQPILIEANLYGGSIWLPQLAHGRGVFGDRTTEILDWIRLLEAMPPEERLKHKFGKM